MYVRMCVYTYIYTHINKYVLVYVCTYVHTVSTPYTPGDLISSCSILFPIRSGILSCLKHTLIKSVSCSSI